MKRLAVAIGVASSAAVLVECSSRIGVDPGAFPQPGTILIFFWLLFVSPLLMKKYWHSKPKMSPIQEAFEAAMHDQDERADQILEAMKRARKEK